VTECHTLIAKKSPPRLPRPSASSRHVARHGGLGDAETHHQKFTMDPRRTPEKVLTGHPYDQNDGLRWKSSGARRASDPVLDIAKALTSRHGASARLSRAGRQSGCRAIAATNARTKSKTVDPKGESTGDEFGCARARRFDGAARSIPTAAQRGFAVRCLGPPRMMRLSRSPSLAGYRQPIKPPTNSHGSSCEEPQLPIAVA